VPIVRDGGAPLNVARTTARTPARMMARTAAGCHSRLMRPRRRPRRVLLRLVVVWIATALALLLASAILSGADVEDFAAALLASALIGLVNALIWPLAIRLLLPITVLTLGLGALVLNGAVVLLVASLDKGLEVDTLGAAIAVAFILTVAYEIRVSGALDPGLLERLEGLEREPGSVETILRGRVRDQAELRGLLDRIRAAGLELVEARRLPGER